MFCGLDVGCVEKESEVVTCLYLLQIFDEKKQYNDKLIALRDKKLQVIDEVVTTLDIKLFHSTRVRYSFTQSSDLLLGVRDPIPPIHTAPIPHKAPPTNPNHQTGGGP